MTPSPDIAAWLRVGSCDAAFNITGSGEDASSGDDASNRVRQIGEQKDEKGRCISAFTDAAR